MRPFLSQANTETLSRISKSTGNSLLIVPKVLDKNSLSEASFYYYGPHLWNSLPEDLRTAENIDIFKSNLKKLNCIYFILFIQLFIYLFTYIIVCFTDTMFYSILFSLFPFLFSYFSVLFLEFYCYHLFLSLFYFPFNTLLCV